MTAALPGFLRIRVVNRILGTVISDDLPHLHQTSIAVHAMQPGNPSNSAIGSFTVHLHPPGSPGYAAAKAIYDQRDYYLRLEFYLGYSATDTGLGRLYFAGPITGIDNQYGETSSFTLTGNSDLQWANLSRPFPVPSAALVREILPTSWPLGQSEAGQRDGCPLAWPNSYSQPYSQGPITRHYFAAFLGQGPIRRRTPEHS